jgi:hypothetical protein
VTETLAAPPVVSLWIYTSWSHNNLQQASVRRGDLTPASIDAAVAATAQGKQSATKVVTDSGGGKVLCSRGAGQSESLGLAIVTRHNSGGRGTVLSGLPCPCRHIGWLLVRRKVEIYALAVRQSLLMLPPSNVPYSGKPDLRWRFCFRAIDLSCATRRRS